MQVVERRREQAAEESRRAMADWQTDSGARRFALCRNDAFEGHSRLSGNILNTPLDSGFRRNDGEARAIKARRNATALRVSRAGGE